MALLIYTTSSEELLSAEVLHLLRAGVEKRGEATLLLPTLAQSLDAQRRLAREPGLALGVRACTPATWAQERWELWGDGRRLVDVPTACIVMRKLMQDVPHEVSSLLSTSPGLVKTLVRFADEALPWVPLLEDGSPDIAACITCGLTNAETEAMTLLGSYREELRAQGLIVAADVFDLLPEALAKGGIEASTLVLAGFSTMPAAQRRMVQKLSETHELSCVLRLGDSSSFDSERRLLEQLAAPLQESDPTEAELPLPRHPALQRLVEAIAQGKSCSPENMPVKMLEAAGPLAEAELVAEQLEASLAQLPQEEGLPSAVVLVPDVARAWRELAPKLAARGFRVRAQQAMPLLKTEVGRAFFVFARQVAELAVRASSWPEPLETDEGLARVLGPMDWWPPRALVGVLMQHFSGVGETNAWWTDVQWRGNRLLSPDDVLSMLLSEKRSSSAVSRATFELMRGRLGTAAVRLLSGKEEHRTTMMAISSIAEALRSQGYSFDSADPRTLLRLVDAAEWAADCMGLITREGAAPALELRGEVRLIKKGELATLAPCSTDVMLACGLTTEEAAVVAEDDLRASLLERLGVEPPLDGMAQARSMLLRLVSAPRHTLLLERSLRDEKAKPLYPAVMLMELLATLGARPGHPEDVLVLISRSETSVSENLNPQGNTPKPFASDEPAAAGELTNEARELVFVPQEGSCGPQGGKPILSASQLETYLDCPYKWFSLRRLRLGGSDAGYSGLEMGSFAHRVLEVSHKTLLLRALGWQGAHDDEVAEALLADLQKDPLQRVAGSRVSADNLDYASELLNEEFKRHLLHMYMVKHPRASQQLLVAHNTLEQSREQRLQKDLQSVLGYEVELLQGFEPRFFEWDFGRHGELVEYAGAYFTGTIDRVDVDAHGNAVILDYKHKSAAGFAHEYDLFSEEGTDEGVLPRRVQSLIYAQIMRRKFAGQLNLVGSVYLSTRAPHALAGAADAHLADRIFGPLSSKRAQAVSVPAAQEGGSGMNELLDRSEELIAQQVEQMLAGKVEARPRDAHSCDFCPVMHCERRMQR